MVALLGVAVEVTQAGKSYGKTMTKSGSRCNEMLLLVLLLFTPLLALFANASQAIWRLRDDCATLSSTSATARRALARVG